MIDEKAPRRLLLIAGEPLRSSWRSLLPADWEIAITGNVEHARMVRQLGACDVVLVASDRLEAGDRESAGRIFGKDGTSVVLVAEWADERVLHAVRAGAAWLPSAAVREEPALLLAALDQAMTRATRREPPTPACRCQARVDRLLDLLWQSAPGTGVGPWFSQRHMLERLDEEVARTRRDGAPLSVILGEVRLGEGDSPEPERVAKLHAWAASQIAKAKRRCDVAGQYGLDGFMLVLPRATPEQARGACRRLRNVLAHPPEGLPTAHVTFGHAGFPGDRPNISGLLSRAEQRLEDSRLMTMA